MSLQVIIARDRGVISRQDRGDLMGEDGLDRTFPDGADDDGLQTLADLRLLAFVPVQVNFRSLAQGCYAVYPLTVV